MKRKLFFFLISLFLSLNILSKEHHLKHLRVIWHEDPSKHAVIAWSGQKAVRGQFLKLIRQEKRGNSTMSVSIKTQKALGIKPYLHSVTLNDLQANSKYSFSVNTNGSESKTFYFITPPEKGKTFKLLFGGDSRTDRNKRREINASIKTYFSNNKDVMALVHGGDFISNGYLWKQWDAWLEDYQLTIQRDGRILPIVPTRGNHEMRSNLFNKIFFWKKSLSMRSNYFVTRFGELSLFTLNTNISHGGRQKSWLNRVLDEESKRQKWLIANYHRPAYPAVKKPGRAKKHWVPLFEKYGVDLVFESDGHTLKRTVPIFQGKRDDKKGIVYLGEGGLGVNLRTPKMQNKWYFQSPGYAKSAYHFFALDVAGERLKVDVISPNKLELIDSILFLPRENRK